MVFALICAALLLIVLAAVSVPLLSNRAAPLSRGQYDRTVYRDQLREVERDAARGVLNQDEAAAARLEIQRRLLAVDPAAEPPVSAPARSPRLAVAAGLFVIVLAGGLYWRLGAPGLSDAPISASPPMQAGAPPAGPPAAPQAEIRRTAEKLEQRLRADPSNAVDWVLYARATSVLNDWARAADAYRRAIELGQRSGDVYAGYGEMLVMAASGVVPPAAHDAFATALARDPANGVARYYLALAEAQAGEERKAIGAWLELAAGLPEDSPMRAEIGRRIAGAAKSAGIEAPALPKGLAAEAPPPGPTPEQMRAAAEMSPDQRASFIGGMIEKLAAKLHEEPNDLEGWVRLGLAYSVRGETAKAVDAYDHAAALKPGDLGIKLRTVAALLSGPRSAEPAPPRAVAILGDVAAVAPDAPEVLWFLGVVAARDGRPEEARGRWTRLLASMPDGEDARMVRAALGELKGR